MSKPATATLTVLAGGALVALGVAVGALASSSGSSGPLAGTSETTEDTTEQATTTKYRTTLSARAEVPKPTGVPATAGGAFSLTLTTKGSSYSVTWTLSYRGLTGKATAAHIHRGKPGKAGPVVVALCQPCRSGRTGRAPVSKAVVDAMKGGSAYVNIHTAKNKAGEIRGQVKRI